MKSPLLIYRTFVSSNLISQNKNNAQFGWNLKFLVTGYYHKHCTYFVNWYVSQFVQAWNVTHFVVRDVN